MGISISRLHRGAVHLRNNAKFSIGQQMFKASAKLVNQEIIRNSLSELAGTNKPNLAKQLEKKGLKELADKFSQDGTLNKLNQIYVNGCLGLRPYKEVLAEAKKSIQEKHGQEVFEKLEKAAFTYLF